MKCYCFINDKDRSVIERSFVKKELLKKGVVMHKKEFNAKKGILMKIRNYQSVLDCDYIIIHRYVESLMNL